MVALYKFLEYIIISVCLSSAKEGSSSDRLIRLLSGVPAIRQMAYELYVLQRRTSSPAEEEEEDWTDFLSSHPHEKDAKILCTKGEEEEEKEDEKEEEDDVEMKKEGVQVEREEEIMKEGEELEDIEEGKNEKEEAAERTKRKKLAIEEKNEEVDIEDEKMKADEFKVLVSCAAKRLERSSEVLYGSKFSSNSLSTGASGTDQKRLWYRLKALDLVRQDLSLNLKRSGPIRNSEILRQNFHHSKVLNEDLIGSILVSKVLAKRFNSSNPDSDISNCLGHMSRIKSQG